MKRRCAPLLLALAAAILLLPSTAAAIPLATFDYSATRDFRLTEGNPNGVWSYGSMPRDFSAFTPFASTVVNESQWHIWRMDDSYEDGTPHIAKNFGQSILFGVTPGQLTLHPGAFGESAVLRFTAPVGGRYDIAARFFPGDSGVMRVGVRKGSAWLWSALDSGRYSVRRLTLRAGEHVDLIVDSGHPHGNTPLECKIDLVSPIVNDIPYDLRLDYDTASGNPNRTWAYGWMPSNLSEFVPFTSTVVDEYNWNGWLMPDSLDGLSPHISVNNSCDTRYGIAPGMLTLHPGPNEEAAVARFVAPVQGNYRFRGQFLAGDAGSMKVGIRRGSSWLWRATDSGKFDVRNQWLAKGEAVDLMVYGGYLCGNTGVECSVTPSRGRR